MYPLGELPADGMCPECFLPSLIRLVYALEFAGEAFSVLIPVVCVECGMRVE